MTPLSSEDGGACHVTSIECDEVEEHLTDEGLADGTGSRN